MYNNSIPTNLNKISAIKILNTFQNLINVSHFLNLICSQMHQKIIIKDLLF